MKGQGRRRWGMMRPYEIIKEISDLTEQIILKDTQALLIMKERQENLLKLIKKLETDVAAKDHTSAVIHLKEAGFLKEEA